MTKQEILSRMQSGEKLRWVIRSVSGAFPEKPQLVFVRDLFLGGQILSTDDLCEVQRLEQDGELICEDDLSGDIIRYWLPGETPW